MGDPYGERRLLRELRANTHTLMTPYYEHAGISIFHGDCREVVASRPPVDCVITDPPYGDTSLDWDRFVRGWMDAAELITKNVWCFGSLSFFMELQRVGECSRWNRAQDIVWEKHNGSSFHADRFKRVHELAVQFYCGDWSSIYKAPVFTNDAAARTVRRKSSPPHMGDIGAGHYKSEAGGPRMMRSVIYARSCHGMADHPTQKPVAVLNPLLRYSVPPDGLVCDMFMGSGSTLVAAKALGIRAIGVDTQESCCEIAARRLSQEVFEFDRTV